LAIGAELNNLAVMDHNQDGGHDHGHAHSPKDFGSVFALATALNVGLVAIEAVYGIADIPWPFLPMPDTIWATS
jgi:hypothetical protein